MKLKAPIFPSKNHRRAPFAGPGSPPPVAPGSAAAPPAPAGPPLAQVTGLSTQQQPPAVQVGASTHGRPSGPVTPLKRARAGLAGPVRQRNAAAMAAGLAFIVIAGLIGASVADSFDDSLEVLVAAEPLVEGQPIAATDLRIVRIAAATGDVQVVAPGELNNLTGRVAAGPIAAGAIIHPSLFVTQQEEIQVVVGVALEPDHYPASGLSPGDRVRVISLMPRRNDDEILVSGQEIAVAEVVDASQLSANKMHFSIRINESSANVVAQLVALERVTLVLVDQSLQLDSVDPLEPAEPPSPLQIEETQ